MSAMQHDRNTNDIQGIRPDEELLYEIRRHPIGLVVVYIQAAIVFIATLLGLKFLLPGLLGESSTIDPNGIIVVVSLVLAGLIWVGLMVYTYVYRQNRLIITNKNLTQIIQYSLFHNKVSELSMANVEDVTALKRGFFSTIMDFGELRVETAGEQNNFNFKFCPKAGYYGKVILDQRQKFIDQDLAS